MLPSLLSVRAWTFLDCALVRVCALGWAMLGSGGFKDLFVQKDLVAQQPRVEQEMDSSLCVQPTVVVQQTGLKCEQEVGSSTRFGSSSAVLDFVQGSPVIKCEHVEFPIVCPIYLGKSFAWPDDVGDPTGVAWPRPAKCRRT